MYYPLLSRHGFMGFRGFLKRWHEHRNTKIRNFLTISKFFMSFLLTFYQQGRKYLVIKKINISPLLSPICFLSQKLNTNGSR